LIVSVASKVLLGLLDGIFNERFLKNKKRQMKNVKKCKNVTGIKNAKKCFFLHL